MTMAKHGESACLKRNPYFNEDLLLSLFVINVCISINAYGETS